MGMISPRATKSVRVAPFTVVNFLNVTMTLWLSPLNRYGRAPIGVTAEGITGGPQAGRMGTVLTSSMMAERCTAIDPAGIPAG
jgi:hypothetical protein